MSKAMETFGKYILLERLAAGGMAEVYLAKSAGISGIAKFVAIKRILPQYSDNPEFIDMFKEEAKIVMNINHSNIVSIFDFGIEQKQFYLVMEFVEGQNLRQVLNHLKKISKYFSIEQIVHIGKEVASGLDHAHRCIDANTGKQLNITHRDMSPQNIMVSFEGEVKVVDFGIAKAETQIEHTKAGTIKGKFGYMSPEQAEGETVDACTDIFSLGIILWELLAQERLFTAQNEAATLKKIKECQIPSLRKLNPNVPVELEKIVNKCLARDKYLRYQTAEAVTKDLSKFLNTNYPDFSKQEFSKYMKSIFQDVYLSNRKKLSEYTKIEFNSSLLLERTSVTQTSASTSTGTEIDSADDENSNLNPSPAFTEQAPSEKIDLSKLRMGSDVKSSSHLRRQASLPLNQSVATHTKTGIPTGTLTNTQAGINSNSQIHIGTSPSIRIPPTKNKSTSSFVIFALTFLFCIAGWQLWQQNKKRIQRHEASVQEHPSENKNLKNIPLNIQSTPSGATVYIDDKPLGQTPLITHIESDQVFHLRLIKEGYLPYEMYAEKAQSNFYSKNVTLIPEPPSAYVTITAVNAGQNPVVFVNRQRMNESLPLTVKIPAGSPVEIRVVNPLTKLEGIQTVTLGQGQKTSIRLILNRQAELSPP